MLIKFFGDFVNFTGVNFRFLSARRICKSDFWVKNPEFATPSNRLETQTIERFQTRTYCW